MHELIRQKRTELWKKQSWILYHDNAPANTSMLVREFLVKNKFVIMPQQPYSPDLVTANFILFPKLKTLMKGEEPRPKKAHQVGSNVKVLLTVFFDLHGGAAS